MNNTLKNSVNKSVLVTVFDRSSSSPARSLSDRVHVSTSSGGGASGGGGGSQGWPHSARDGSSSSQRDSHKSSGAVIGIRGDGSGCSTPQGSTDEDGRRGGGGGEDKEEHHEHIDHHTLIRPSSGNGSGGVHTSGGGAVSAAARLFVSSTEDVQGVAAPFTIQHPPDHHDLETVEEGEE